MKLVSLQQASDHLRRDTDADDIDLSLKIAAASRSVLNYLGAGADFFLSSDRVVQLDSNLDPIGIPEEVQMATLILIGEFYSDRQADKTDRWMHGYLPAPVINLLYPLRTPVMK